MARDHDDDRHAEADADPKVESNCQLQCKTPHRVVLMPTLGMSPAFLATVGAYCRLVRRPADRLVVVGLQAGPPNRILRRFPYTLWELNPSEKQARAEVALQTASEKADRLVEMMAQHGISEYTYSFRLYHEVTETLGQLYTEHKADAMVLGREFDFSRNSTINDLAKLVSTGLVILP